jgi:hypothetical protein
MGKSRPAIRRYGIMPPRKLYALLPLLALTLSAATPASPAAWSLRGDGLSRVAAGKAQILRFGTPRKSALATVAAVLGSPIESKTIPDCGQGDPMMLVSYKGGLTIQFLKGKFSGWSLDGPVDIRMKTEKGIAIGSSRADVMRAYPDADIDDGPLGVMFTREAGPSGFLDSMKPGARVIGLFAGETCMI